MNIIKTEYYTPKEIIKMKIMTANSFSGQRQMLFRYIRNGELKSKNLGSDLQPRYIILGEDLLKFKKEYEQKRKKDKNN